MEEVRVKKPIIVYVDGIDGAGKTTFIKHFKKSLEKRYGDDLKVYIQVYLPDNPSVNLFKKEMFEGKLSVMEQLIGMLHFGNQIIRAMNTEEHYQEYDIILVDRSRATTFAYQVYPNCLCDYIEYELFSEIMSNDPKGACYIFLNVSAEKASERLMGREEQNSFDHKPLEEKQVLVEGYDAFYEDISEQFYMVRSCYNNTQTRSYEEIPESDMSEIEVVQYLDTIFTLKEKE